ncbi:spodomicin-like [Leguminivora glycinivorella]|uniref:spodomicin-like n=1 Tax=Leguminivora glycinivorella TaxID=1035111 RepID=UPI00200F9F21|nr:spodomicin-like [Leguminivora glycinivorella]
MFTKTIVLLVALTLLASSEAATNPWKRTWECDETCNRIEREKTECCRQHGHVWYGNCERGQMYCY